MDVKQSGGGVKEKNDGIINQERDEKKVEKPCVELFSCTNRFHLKSRSPRGIYKQKLKFFELGLF